MNSNLGKPARILIRGVNWLGDAVMTTPALQRLREALPEAHLSLLTPEKLADLWHRHPAVDQVFVFSADEGLFKIGGQLRRERFDAAVALPNSPRSALELWLARIPRRIGYAAPIRSWFLTDALPRRRHAIRMHKRSEAEVRALISTPSPGQPAPVPPEAHHIYHYLPLVEPLGARPLPTAPQLVVSETEVRTALQKLCPDAGPDRPLVALNAGAEYGPAKRWPADRFAATAWAVHAAHPCHWLLLGGKADLALTAGLAVELRAAGLPVDDLAGRTSLRELCAVLRVCRVVLTNDTGPMHVAAALGAPVVALFGSTSPELTGPGLPGDPRHRLLRGHAACAPCFLRQCPIDFRCMTGLTVETVADTVLTVLRGQ